MGCRRDSEDAADGVTDRGGRGSVLGSSGGRLTDHRLRRRTGMELVCLVMRLLMRQGVLGLLGRFVSNDSE